MLSVWSCYLEHILWQAITTATEAASHCVGFSCVTLDLLPSGQGLLDSKGDDGVWSPLCVLFCLSYCCCFMFGFAVLETRPVASCMPNKCYSTQPSTPACCYCLNGLSS